MHQQLGEQRSPLMPPFDGRRPAVAWEMQAFAGAGGPALQRAGSGAFRPRAGAGPPGPLGAAAERLVTPLAAYRGGQIGYAVFIDGPPERRTWSHDGLTGGYRAQLTMYPDSGEVLAVLAANRQAPLSQLNTRLAAARYPAQQHADPGRAAAPGRAGRRVPDRSGIALVCVVHEGALYVRATGSVFRAYLAGGTGRPTSARPVAPNRFASCAMAAVGRCQLAQYGRLTRGRPHAEPVPQQAVLAAPRPAPSSADTRPGCCARRSSSTCRNSTGN
jgi:D-alanyl-D-alanine-carboxypeptidase/D-alanyl-D-alanine-endopeptidase